MWWIKYLPFIPAAFFFPTVLTILLLNWRKQQLFNWRQRQLRRRLRRSRIAAASQNTAPATSQSGTPEPASGGYAIESTSYNELASDNREQLPLPESFTRCEPDIAKPARADISTGRETAIHSDNQEPFRPGKRPVFGKQIAFMALYTVAIASASIAGFSILNGDRDAEPMAACIQARTARGPESVVIPGSTVVRPDSTAETLRPKKHVVSANSSDAPQPSQTGEPGTVLPPARETAAAAPSPAAEITPEEQHFENAEAEALLARGDAFFATGDLASARLFYESAVAAGNGMAALQLGGTFDPAFLVRARIGRTQGHLPSALYWYRQARDLGNGDAEILIRSIENTMQ